ncbi:GMC oxidoreductase [Halobacteriaceae archaeon GCM10025711]
MVKISDDASGRVLPNGTVSKRVTDADQEKLDAGVALATETLVAAGADESSILVTKHQGAHPGGTAAIGRVVDADLRTEVDGLYVCDASVLPEPPGAPRFSLSSPWRNASARRSRRVPMPTTGPPSTPTRRPRESTPRTAREPAVRPVR